MNETTHNGLSFEIVATEPAKEAGYTVMLLKRNGRFALVKKDPKGITREMWLNFKTLSKALRAATA